MNWCVEFEEPSEERRNRKSGDGIPDKEHDDAVVGLRSFQVMLEWRMNARMVAKM